MEIALIAYFCILFAEAYVQKNKKFKDEE